MINSKNPEYMRYALLKNSILYLMDFPSLDPEIFGKAINIFDEEIKNLEKNLAEKGFLFDKDNCATTLDLPFVYLKSEDGELVEQGYRANEVEIVIPKENMANLIVDIIKEIKITPLKPML